MSSYHDTVDWGAKEFALLSKSGIGQSAAGNFLDFTSHIIDTADHTAVNSSLVPYSKPAAEDEVVSKEKKEI